MPQNTPLVTNSNAKIDTKTGLSRRKFATMGALAATSLSVVGAEASSDEVRIGACNTVPDELTAERPGPQKHWRDFSAVETTLAFRNHGMHAELLREPITPLGAHYLLIHFDNPALSAAGYELAVQ